MKIVSVITGDIVGSSLGNDSQRRAMLDIVENSVEEIQGELDVPLQLEFFRGDAFQILAERPQKALLVAVLLRAALCGNSPKDNLYVWDARMAIGVGGVTYLTDTLAKSNGDAFVYSGRTLDKMWNERLAIKTQWETINEEFSVSTPFADDLISRWTRVQSDVIYDYLLYNVTQGQIAREKRMTPQNVSKVLKTGRVELIINYVKRFEKLIYDNSY
jgi:hypothetical protein